MQVEVSASANRRVIPAGLLSVVGMAAMAIHGGNDSTHPWIWLVLCGASQLVTMWMHGGAAHHQSRFHIASQGRLLALGAYCSVAWGAAAWLLLPGQNPQSETVLTVATAVIFVGGGAGIVHRPILLTLACPGPLVFAAGLMVMGGPERMVLAIGFILLPVVTVLYSNKHTAAIRLAIRLSIENERLLAESAMQRRLADTARMEAENARHKAELANKGKTAFLAAAGHDLRQPMHALVQYHADLARRNASTTLDETIQRIGKSLDAMGDLLDAMLEVSKLTTGTVQARIAATSMDAVADRLDAQLRPLAEAKGLSFTIDIDGSPWVETDDVLLERILRNLLLNAIRYTPRGRIGIRCRQHAQQCRILVWDTGIGIPRSEQTRVFEEFYQVANDARDVRKGLGLGLAIVRQLGQLLGHRIRLRSRPGQGSVFIVSVPIRHAGESPGSDSASACEPDFVKGAFILLIDDNPGNLAATASTLRAFGAQVLGAQGSREAIEGLQSTSFAPQLVLSDYRLEGETGIEVIRAVTNDQKARHGDHIALAALLITGDTAPEELLRAQSAGLAMLHKPLAVDRLYRAVNHALALQIHARTPAEPR